MISPTNKLRNTLCGRCVQKQDAVPLKEFHDFDTRRATAERGPGTRRIIGHRYQRATLTASTTEPSCSFDSRGANSVPHNLTPALSLGFSEREGSPNHKKEPPTYLRQAESITSKSVNDLAASLRRELDGMFLMQMLYYARHHRLDGNVLNLVGISGGIA